MVIIIVLGGGALLVSGGLGVAVAAVAVGRSMRNGATVPSAPPVTRARAILIGTVSAVAGWALAVLAVVVFVGLSQYLAA